MTDPDQPQMSDIDRQRARLRRLLRGRDPAVLTRRPPNGDWSIIENVRHLLFAEQLHLGGYLPRRFEFSRLGMTGMTAKRFANVGKRATKDVDEVFAEWDAVHKLIRQAMKSATGPDVDKALWRNHRHLRIHTDLIERLLIKSTKGPATAAKVAPKPGAGASKGAPRKTAKRENPAVLLSGGNPQVAKADGDAPVRAYIAAMPGWKRDVGRRLDALVARSVPDVRRAVKWNSPFYGIEGQGWFLSFHVFTNYVKVTFFAGTSLRPAPPGGKTKDARWIDVHEHDLDEAQMSAWIKQAAALPGWLP